MQMTQHVWNRLTPSQRTAQVDNSNLTPQFIGREGWRVEVVDHELSGGATRRFIIGKSTGWRPCHLELCNRRSHGGPPVMRSYQSIKFLYRATS